MASPHLPIHLLSSWSLWGWAGFYMFEIKFCFILITAWFNCNWFKDERRCCACGWEAYHFNPAGLSLSPCIYFSFYYITCLVHFWFDKPKNGSPLYASLMISFGLFLRMYCFEFPLCMVAYWSDWEMRLVDLDFTIHSMKWQFFIFDFWLLKSFIN